MWETGVTKMQNLWNNFPRSEDGSVAIIFGLCLLVLVAVVGFAVDEGRAVTTASIIQASLDAAALAGAKAMVEDDATEEQIAAITERVMAGQMETARLEKSSWGGLQSSFDRQTGTVDVRVNMTLPTTFTRILKINSINATMSGRAAYKITAEQLRAAFLDIAGRIQPLRLQ
jgi:Flp pilus assembly protein TadG